ncbi:MAG: DNA polymerase IV [Chitinivibrionales bacterium]|nr:DNA polymerase IV [Chitinivibrionales bacterium]
MMSHHRTIFHVDMDAFFCSVEQRDNPSYRGKPVIVGARPGTRGVVSAASYEARKYGVHSAMPINQAFRRCPHGIYLRPRMHVYAQSSREIMAILRSFSPIIEQISVDEAFLDITGTQRLWGNPLETAQKISCKIKKEQHLTASIGVAPNKFLAKLASDMDKPDGITVTPFEINEIESWLAPLPVSRVWGVGKKTQEVFARMGIQQIGDLQNLSLQCLNKRFGKMGVTLYDLARGVDSRPVSEQEGVKSVSREHTFARDCRDVDEWKRILLALSRDVGRRARKYGITGKSVVLIYRMPDFSKHTRRITLSRPTNLTRDIFSSLVPLLPELKQKTDALRLIGTGLTNLTGAGQMDLFSNKQREAAWEASENAMDRLNVRFGKKSIFLAGEIE